MADKTAPSASTAPRSGALQSSLSIALHTHYAIRLWNGRKRELITEEGKKGKRPEILSMPQAIARAGMATRDADADNPYADMLLVKLETVLSSATDKMQEYIEMLNTILQAIPANISLSDVASAEPLNISVFSRSPLGYRCVFLLVGYDQLAMKAFQAAHYGLISRSRRDQLLNDGGHAVRQVYAVIQQYRTIAVTRHDINTRNDRGLEVINQYGEPGPDILSGKKRSCFSPPLKTPSMENEPSEK